MKNVKMYAVIMLCALLPISGLADESQSISGIFSRVQGQEYKFDGKTVEVIEFMSFYCIHCYDFEKSVSIIKGNFPKKIKWKIIPVYWGNSSSKPGEAYFLADEAGKGEQMKKALFHAKFVEKKDIGNIEVLESIAVELGIGFDFSRKLRAGEKAKEATEALNMAKLYNLEATPTIVIAGNLMSNPQDFNTNIDAFRDNAITIIKSILNR